MNKEDLVKNLESGKISMVDFWAPWCGPCKIIGPILDKIDEKHPIVNLIKVNVDENGDLASEYGIRNIPTLLFMDESGNVLAKEVGMKSREDLESIIDRLRMDS